MTIGFLTGQRDEHAIPLPSPRVIRDAFHVAIKWAEDLANWNRGGKSFELHEVSAFGCGALNGVEHWLRPPAPPAGLCEFPHAAQDRDNAPLFPRCAKRSARLRDRHRFAPVSSAHRPAPPDRQTPADRPANSR